MLYWSGVFLAVALVGGIFGFSGLATGSEAGAQLIFGVFGVLFLGALIVRAVFDGER